MQKTVSWLELARIPRSGRGWLEGFGVIEPQFLNLPDEVISLIHLTIKGYKEVNLSLSRFFLHLCVEGSVPDLDRILCPWVLCPS